MDEKSQPRLDTYRQAQKRWRSAVARLAAGQEWDFKSEGLCPHESRSLAVRLGVLSFYRSGEPMRTMEIPDGANYTLASELFADAQNNVARVYGRPWPLVANHRVAMTTLTLTLSISCAVTAYRAARATLKEAGPAVQSYCGPDGTFEPDLVRPLEMACVAEDAFARQLACLVAEIAPHAEGRR